MLTVAVVIFWGCKKENGQGNDGNVDGGDAGDTIVVVHEYVDLGLPSGTLWATCNVGADAPEDFGDYFAWGETMPKDSYDWKSYRYGDMVNELFAMTKYCTDSSYGFDGFVDSLTLLEPADDAVRANWGADWRMPTGKEWEELYRKTICTGTTQNGVNGWLFTASNGNSLFLPAAGFRLDGEAICAGLGTYWSSSLHTDYPYRAWSFHFDSDNCHVCGTYERNRGQTVRAVRVTK